VRVMRLRPACKRPRECVIVAAKDGIPPRAGAHA
jgi:hypothetical protein